MHNLVLGHSASLKIKSNGPIRLLMYVFCQYSIALYVYATLPFPSKTEYIWSVWPWTWQNISLQNLNDCEVKVKYDHAAGFPIYMYGCLLVFYGSIFSDYTTFWDTSLKYVYIMALNLTYESYWISNLVMRLPYMASSFWSNNNICTNSTSTCMTWDVRIWNMSNLKLDILSSLKVGSNNTFGLSHIRFSISV